MGHFAVGATCTTVLLWLLWPSVEHRVTIVVFGGLWAMIPDVGKLDSFETEAVLAFHDSAAANLFWGHQYLDVLDTGDSPEFSALALGLFFVVSAVLEATSVWSRRRRIASTTGDGRPVRNPDRSTGEGTHWPAVAGVAPTVVVRLAVAVLVVGVGAALVVAPFVSDVASVGILVGTGAVLALLGADVLLGDVRFATLLTRVVPAPVRLTAVVALALAAASLALVLLLRVRPLTERSIPYGALAFLLVVLLVRLRPSMMRLVAT